MRRLKISAALLTAGAVIMLMVPTPSDPVPPSQPAPRAPEVTPRAQVISGHADAPAQLQGPDSWVTGQVMVVPALHTSPDALAERWGAGVVRSYPRSGLVVLTVPEGMDAPEFAAALRREGDIISGRPHARITGASTSEIEAHQWYLKKTGTPDAVQGDLSTVVVAVLDSGVAYTDHSDESGSYLAAPSLSDNPIVSPWDFVNDDSWPLDDHQHGTHIASIIGSQGDIDGVAPGVALMPLKVLDEHNSGYEADLIEALYWAKENGADVVNMSLSFGEDYVPSPELLDALTEAHEAGAVLVAAAGNSGLDEISWPARSPHVISVGAFCMTGKRSFGSAPYTNSGLSLDIMGPGGCIDRDKTGDGFVDGIIGETISLGDPEEIGYWMMAGTSQAAAVISATVARMIAAGGDSVRADRYIHYSSMKWSGHGGHAAGNGAGRIRVGDAIDKSLEGFPNSRAYREGEFALSMMPYLIDNGDGTVSPAVYFTSVDDLQDNAKDVKVLGRFYGPTSETFSCELTYANGARCTAVGSPVSATDASGEPAALAWRIAIRSMVRNNKVAFRPQRLIFASNALEDVLSSLEDHPDASGAAVAFYWRQDQGTEIGDVAEAYSLVDTGTGIATSPMGLLFTPGVIEEHTVVQDLDLDGTGIATSPFGFKLIDIPPYDPVNGTGIATSPFGFRLAAFDAYATGTGIATSPFGAKVLADPGLPEEEEGIFSSDPVMLSTATVGVLVEENLQGTAISAMLDRGGWLTGDGGLPGQDLTGSSWIAVGPEVVGSDEGTGAVQISIE